MQANIAVRSAVISVPEEIVTIRQEMTMTDSSERWKQESYG